MRVPSLWTYLPRCLWGCDSLLPETLTNLKSKLLNVARFILNFLILLTFESFMVLSNRHQIPSKVARQSLSGSCGGGQIFSQGLCKTMQKNMTRHPRIIHFNRVFHYKPNLFEVSIFVNFTRWWQLKYFLFSPRIPGEMIQFDEYFFRWVETTN